MSDLFGDDSASFSVFAARKVAEKQKPAAKNTAVQKQAPKKKRQVVETTLYRTHVTITEVGKGTPMGEYMLQVMKRNQAYHLVCLSMQNSVFASIPCDNSIHWQSFESCNCSTILPDTKQEVLIHFADEEEQKVITIVSQIGKVSANHGVSFINDVPSNQYAQNLINYISLDMSQNPIKVVDRKRDIEPSDTTIQGKIAKSKSPGTSAVIKTEDNIFMLLEVRANPRILPSVPVKDDEEDEIIEEEEQDEDDELLLISDVQQEIQQKFDQLALMLKSMTPKKFPVGFITVSNSRLLYLMQCAVNASAQKDNMLTQLQAKLDKLQEAMTETQERAEMKGAMDAISDELIQESQSIIDTDDAISALQKKLENNKQELVAMAKKYEEQEKQMREQYAREMVDRKKQVDNEIAQKEAHIKEVNDEKDILVEQLVNFTQENANLEKRVEEIKEEEKEIEKTEQETKEKLKNSISQLVRKVFGMLNENIDEETEYGGSMVMRATRTALQRCADKIINGDEEEEEEEQPEEAEEEAAEQEEEAAEQEEEAAEQEEEVVPEQEEEAAAEQEEETAAEQEEEAEQEEDMDN